MLKEDFSQTHKGLQYLGVTHTVFLTVSQRCVYTCCEWGGGVCVGYVWGGGWGGRSVEQKEPEEPEDPEVT